MRDMSLSWPRWIGFLVVAVLLWLGLSALQPDANRMAAGHLDRLTEATLGRVVADLAALPEVQHLEDIGAIAVHGGETCQHVVTAALGERVVPGAASTLRVDCRVGDGRAGVTLTRVGAVAAVPIASSTRRLPSGLSLLPPLLAILFAFFFRRVALALLSGVVLGGFLMEDFALLPSLQRTGETYLLGTAIDPFNVQVYAFTLILIGMVNVSIVMGGMRGVLDLIGRVARGVRSTQAAVAAMGLAVFFDDYANTVVVGGAARPLTDERGISREKLAYIVDSTAAPVAGVAIVSTWIGIEIEYFEKALPTLGTFSDIVPGGYAFFFEALPYRFYCFFAIALVLLVAWTGRDFGPMFRAERLARKGLRTEGILARSATGSTFARVAAREDAPPRWVNGILPIAVVIAWTLIGSLIDGAASLEARGRLISWTSPGDLRDAFIAVPESVRVLLIASIAGSVTALLLAIGQRILSLRQALVVWVQGVLGMLPAIGILILAMAIRTVTDDMLAAHWLSAQVGGVPVELLPLAVFLLAGAIAFATGTSWGTMAILIPVALPICAELLATDPAGATLLFLVGASVLDGAIFGDHCSLISDTTVMSSIASGCDHVQHVRTQLPYAFLAMSAAALPGYALVAWAGSVAWWLAWPLGLLWMLLILRLFGRPADA